MIIAQVCLRLAKIKGHSKCAVLSHSTMPQMSPVVRERAVGMLAPGMSTRAVASEFNVNFSTISRLQRRSREFGSIFNWPHNQIITKKVSVFLLWMLRCRDFNQWKWRHKLPVNIIRIFCVLMLNMLSARLKLKLDNIQRSSVKEDDGRPSPNLLFAEGRRREKIKSNQIKSLLLSHHHSTSALVSEILMSVLQTVQKNNRQFTYGQTVQKNNKQFTYGQTVQKNNRQFTYGQTVQKNNKQFTYGQTVQKTTNNLPMDRQCKKTTNNLPMDRQCKKTTNNLPMDRQCKKTTNNLPMDRQCKKTTNNLHMDRQCKKNCTEHLQCSRQCKKNNSNLHMDRQCKKNNSNLHMDRQCKKQQQFTYGQYIFTDCTEDNAQNTHTYTQYAQCTTETHSIINDTLYTIWAHLHYVQYLYIMWSIHSNNVRCNRL